MRPRAGDPRGRSVHEQMVHQCVSENLWFIGMLGIDVNAPPLPAMETRLEFMKRYAEDSGKRMEVLRSKDESWWESKTKFFDVPRSRAWVMVRRIAHTAHHRGQQMAMLRMLPPGFAQQLWSNGRYRRIDAKSRADDLWISESECVIRRRRGGWRGRNRFRALAAKP